MNCKPDNMIMKALDDEENQLIYVLYRHGQILTIDRRIPEMKYAV